MLFMSPMSLVSLSYITISLYIFQYRHAIKLIVENQFNGVSKKHDKNNHFQIQLVCLHLLKYTIMFVLAGSFLHLLSIITTSTTTFMYVSGTHFLEASTYIPN